MASLMHSRPWQLSFYRAEFINLVKYKNIAGYMLMPPMSDNHYKSNSYVFASLKKKNLQMNLKCNKHDIFIFDWEVDKLRINMSCGSVSWPFSSHLQFKCASSVRRSVSQSGTCLPLTGCFVVVVLVMIVASVSSGGEGKALWLDMFFSQVFF